MKKLLLFVLLAVGTAAAPASAQQQAQALVVTSCGSQSLAVATYGFITMDTTGKICDGGSGGGASGSPYQFQSAGTGQYAVSIASSTALTVPSGSLIAEICVETASARYTTTGTTPTSSIGIPVAAGGCFQLAGAAVLSAFRVIGSGATMDVEYFK